MIQPLYSLVFGEVAVILVLLYPTQLREPLLMLLDRLKEGRGPVVASTAGGTLFVILVSILFSITSIQQRSAEARSINPTDQVLLANHLLEASLLGFALFLGLMIDRIHVLMQREKKSDEKSEDVKEKEEEKEKEKEEEKEKGKEKKGKDKGKGKRQG